MSLRVVDHPLIAHHLRELRDKNTPPDRFRRHTRDITTALVYEATRHLQVAPVPVETPLGPTEGTRIAQAVAAVPILRAGLGMLEPVTLGFPEVRVGYLGFRRDETTAKAEIYYENLPRLDDCFVLCLDPMLATGGTAVQAIDRLRRAGATNVTLVSVVAAPEGVRAVGNAHPQVDIVVASLDHGLNAKKYIVPGLGDFGDRLYGTP